MNQLCIHITARYYCIEYSHLLKYIESKNILVNVDMLIYTYFKRYIDLFLCLKIKVYREYVFYFNIYLSYFLRSNFSLFKN